MMCDLSWAIGTRLRRSVEWFETELPKDSAEENLRRGGAAARTSRNTSASKTGVAPAGWRRWTSRRTATSPAANQPMTWKAVQDVGGVAQVAVHGGAVGLRAVGDDDLHAGAPAVALGGEEPAQRLSGPVRHHGQQLAGVA